MTVNVRAITDHKTALGLVEVPACQTLRDLASRVPADQAVVEVGAYKGRTTAYLAWGSSIGNGAPVFSIDPWELRAPESWPEGYADNKVKGVYSETATREYYEEHLRRCGVDTLVEQCRGFSLDVASTWSQPIGLFWQDGDHSYDAIRADLRAWAPFVAPGGYIVMHDAGCPDFGVVEGARSVLGDDPEWDWSGRKLQLWAKNPKKRGILIVRKHG